MIIKTNCHESKTREQAPMKKAVRDELYAHEATWLKMKPFAKAVAVLDEGIKALNKAVARQASTSTGVTIDKMVLANTAIDLVVKIARNVRAYALDANNNTLYAQVNYNKGRLLNCPDNEQLGALINILDISEDVVAGLKDYNVTADHIAAARRATAALETALSPRNAIIAHSTATLSVADYEQSTRLALDKLDNMIHNFEETNPLLVSSYKQARVVIDRGIRHEQGGDAK